MNPALDSRARFEDWFANNVPARFSARDFAWEAWQAAIAGAVPVAAYDRLHAHAETLAARVLELEAAIASMAVPEGWQLVPLEPTPAMLKAGDQKTWVLPSGDCWSAMLAAAPTPQDPPIAALAAKETT